LQDSPHRRPQPLRYLHDCSDCCRLDRQLPRRAPISPPTASRRTHAPTAEAARRRPARRVRSITYKTPCTRR